jgi:hypothetical protein
MKFFSFASVALAAFTGLVAAIDSTTTVNNIMALTDLSSSTTKMVSSINVVTVAVDSQVRSRDGWPSNSQMLTIVQKVPQGIVQIVQSIDDDVNSMLVRDHRHR